MTSIRLDPLTCVSVFSGAMGLDLGLEAAGFAIRFASDCDKAALATIRANRPAVACAGNDVRELTGRYILEAAGLDRVDVLAGGPPCQAFSTAGRRLSTDDPRNGPLVFEFVRLVDELRPSAFIMENVKGILSAPLKWRALPYNNNGKRIDEHYGSLLSAVLGKYAAIGYSASVFELNAADFGVPQVRRRVFVIGFRDGALARPPIQTHSTTGDMLHRRWQTIGEAWEGLPEEVGLCAKFSPRKLKYLRMVPPGSNWRSLPDDVQRESMGMAYFAKGGRTGYWRRLSVDETAPTILTEPQNASTSLCHPFHDRPISVREAARLQTFPDSWEFVGTAAQQYRLIGNAVPPLLAEAAARSIHAQLCDVSVNRAA